MTKRFAVVYEAEADFRTATELADRALRSTLGFDPRLRSHELTACKDDNATRSPKRVLRELSGDNRERERRCWCETTLATLRQWGGGNGLAAYLEEVRERLAGLIGHPS